MKRKDLQAFGQTLRRLRQTTGFSQEQVAEKLSLIHANSNPNDDLKIDGNRISKWERAFKSKNGREWRPKRQHLLYLVELFAEQLTPQLAQQWAVQAGSQLTKTELENIFETDLQPGSIYIPPPPNLDDNLKRLALLPEQQLFGVDHQQEQLSQLATQPNEPWIIAVAGIGGIGKTSLAIATARQIAPTGRFHHVVWVSAKQEEFIPGGAIKVSDQPALNIESLTDNLLEQLDSRVNLARSAQEKQNILSYLLKSAPCLVVIDNLETVADYETLLPQLSRWANPTRFLLTTRHALYAHANVYNLNLMELSADDAFNLLQHEAKLRGLPELAAAPETALAQIHQVVGGNPLALKLVVGLIKVLPLAQILRNLKQAQGESIEQLYTFIYWQAWNALSNTAQQVLLIMPLAQNSTLAHIRALVPEILTHEVSEAIGQLANLSLLQIGGPIEERRYSIHRLTETFLLNEALKWGKL